ncbi:hypothetical protein ACIGFL_14350 [Pseudomonas sp. NPDC077649]|uniref:hypothetical protein n=1 Tax=Pseudomonas sp. NPDC077649 TaxID=3364423 RepID=UPI0037C71CA9
MNQAEQLQQELADMQESLRRMDDRYNLLSMALQQLTQASNLLCNQIAVMCEAHMAGDNALVMRQVEQFTNAYRANLKPADGRVH